MKKFYSYLMVLFHFLYLYASPIATLSVGDIVLLVVFVVLLLKELKNSKLNRSMPISYIGLGICFYMILHFLLYCLLSHNTSYSDILLPLLRLLLYYLTVAIFSKKYFDVNTALNVYRKIAVISSVFLMLQIFFLTFFGKYIPGQIPGIKLLNQNLQAFNHQMMNGDIGHRARSFFSEPSYYAIYVLLYLCIDLFCLKKHEIKSLIIITLGLLLSGSGTAILATALSYVIFLVKSIEKLNRKKLYFLIIASLTVILLFPIYKNTAFYESFYERTFVNKTSTEGRFGTYDDIFNNSNDSIYIKLFGRSIKKIDIYIAGVPRIYFYYGYLGLTVMLVLSIIYAFKLKNINRASLLLLILLSIGTEMIFSYMILLYGSFLVAKIDSEIKEV